MAIYVLILTQDVCFLKQLPDIALPLQFEKNLLGRLVGGHVGGIQLDLRLFGGFIGIVNARKSLDKPCSRLGIDAFAIP